MNQKPLTIIYQVDTERVSIKTLKSYSIDPFESYSYTRFNFPSFDTAKVFLKYNITQNIFHSFHRAWHLGGFFISHKCGGCKFNQWSRFEAPY